MALKLIWAIQELKSKRFAEPEISVDRYHKSLSPELKWTKQ